MARILSSLAVVVVACGLSSAAFAAQTTTVPAEEQPTVSNVERADHEQGTPTLFGRRNELGGYAGLDVAYTRMFGEDGAVVGLQGALLVNHRLSLGLAGYAWTNPQAGPDNVFGESRSFQTAYGGATVRYSFLPRSPVYFSVGGLLGGGAVMLARDDDRDGSDELSNQDSDGFALFQPDVTVHANLTRWMRLGITAGYRFTSGVDHFGFDESDVNGVIFGGQVQIGRF